jgi:hypothetical protein
MTSTTATKIPRIRWICDHGTGGWGRRTASSFASVIWATMSVVSTTAAMP